jgi:hypothetical protein
MWECVAGNVGENCSEAVLGLCRRLCLICWKAVLICWKDKSNCGEQSCYASVAVTGGRGGLAQQVHCEFFESFEAIHSHFTQWVSCGFFLKVPTTLITI